MKVFGARKRRDAQCYACLSPERHRLIWLYLKNQTPFSEAPLKVLHSAPEARFWKWFENLKNLEYVSAGLFSKKVMVEMDITDIKFGHNTFDVVLCSHVLEHVQDDRLAMREIFRVLKPGGWAILMVPIKGEENFEDESVTDPK